MPELNIVEKVIALEAVELLKNLTPEQLSRIATIAREVKHRAADRDVRTLVLERHGFDAIHAEAIRGQLGGEFTGHAPHGVHRHWVGIGAEDVVALAQQVDEIAAVAAARVEHAHAGRDASTQDLIEEVNIDVPELLLEIAHLPMILGA